MPGNSPTGAPAPPERLYRWFPRYVPRSVEIGGAGLGPLAAMGVTLAVCAAVLSLPAVVRATGLSASTIWTVLGSYFACMALNDTVLAPWSAREPLGFRVQLVVLVTYNAFFTSLFVVLSNDPHSPLWFVPFAWAFFMGSWSEIDASIFQLVAAMLGPLGTIPVFLARGADPRWSIAAPVMAATVCGAGYHMLAVRQTEWRRIRREQAATIDALREEQRRWERERVARDLHDSLGNVLALVSAYGDLVERNAEHPDVLRRIAGTIRAMGRTGLGELRVVLEAIDPGDGTLDRLANALASIARRSEEAELAIVRLQKEGDPHVRIPSAVHMAAVQIAKEALTNAVRHGRAERVDIGLRADGSVLELAIEDDGIGLPADGQLDGGGRGLVQMRKRAEELHGAVTIEPRDRGVIVRCRLPMA